MNLNRKIGLGSVQFGTSYGVSNKNGQTTSVEVSEILKYADQSGMKIIDTATAYGKAEEVLGCNDLNNFKIVSKFLPQEGDNSITFQLKKSLDKLNVESLYGYLAHRPLSLIDNLNQWEELLILKQEKKIKKIGFSLNEPKELELLLNKKMMPDLIQVPYNYYDNRFKHLLIELKANGCEIHTRSAFLQGLFFADVEKLPSFFDEVKNNIKELQLKYEDNLSSVLLKYVLSLSFIDVVIMGVENKYQLENNLTNIKAACNLLPNDFNFSELLLMPFNWPKIA